MILCQEFYAQSFGIKRIETSVNGIPGEMKGDPGDLFNCTITYTNTGPGIIHLFMNRYQKVIPPYWSSCYCYVQCESPATDTLTLEIQPYSTTEVTLPFKTDSVNPGQATSSFKVFQIGYEAKADTIHMLASTLKNGIGIRENKLTPQVSLFPNPSSGVLNMIGINPINEVNVFDLSGKVRGHYTGIEQNFFSMNTTGYDPGIYFVQIKSNGEIITQKFTIYR